jgi:hypothetical protein
MSEDLLRQLLSCARAEAGGATDHVRRRRDRFLNYWYASLCCRFRDTDRPLDLEWHVEVCARFEEYAEACDRLLDLGVPGDDAVGGEVFEAVREAVRAVDQAMAGYDEAVDRGDKAAADQSIRRALRELFDWNNNRRLRAYLYCGTGEALTDAAAKTEKSRLLDALDRCRGQLAGEIDSLLR